LTFAGKNNGGKNKLEESLKLDPSNKNKNGGKL
jgi:hypothetical protein